VAPAAALEDVTKWELWSSLQETEIFLEPGTWHFTLKGYHDQGLMLTGSIGEQTIRLGAPNILSFTIKPVLEGQGNLYMVIELLPGLA
jgi:hypothetical protein